MINVPYARSAITWRPRQLPPVRRKTCVQLRAQAQVSRPGASQISERSGNSILRKARRRLLHAPACSYKSRSGHHGRAPRAISHRTGKAARREDNAAVRDTWDLRSEKSWEALLHKHSSCTLALQRKLHNPSSVPPYETNVIPGRKLRSACAGWHSLQLPVDCGYAISG